MKLLKIFVLSTLISTFAFAQDNLPNNGYALSFGISQNFTLSDFDGYIAFKKIFNGGNQLRFLLRPEYTHKNSSIEDNQNIYDKIETTANGLSLSIGADYLWRVLQNNNVQMYGGGGVLVGYGNSKTEQTKTYSDSTLTSTSKINFWTLGIRGILGAEWLVTKNIGLHAEYILNFKYNNSKTDAIQDSNPSGSRKNDEFSLGQSVFFGISFYL